MSSQTKSKYLHEVSTNSANYTQNPLSNFTVELHSQQHASKNACLLVQQKTASETATATAASLSAGEAGLPTVEGCRTHPRCGSHLLDIRLQVAGIPALTLHLARKLLGFVRQALGTMTKALKKPPAKLQA